MTSVSDYRNLPAQVEARRAELGGVEGVALTNGYFDPLHVGHLRLLKRISEEADLVIVAVNADKALRASQGGERPSAPLPDRMEMIDALYMVDFVTSFREPSADELIRCLRPDVYAKGADWATKALPERASAEAAGARIMFLGD